MNVDTPLWLLLTASAFGGAALTGLITLGTKLLDLRHRHDETRRDHYVAMLTALDDLQQALVVAADESNRAADAWSPDPAASSAPDSAEGGTERPSAVYETGVEARNKLIAARRAVLVVYLFAPKAVAVLVRDLYDEMSEAYVRLHYAAEGEKVDEPTFPAVLWNDLRDAIRRDLGVRKIRLTIT